MYRESGPVLIIDDSAAICDVATRMIMKHGLKVVATLTAEEGLALIRRDPPALVLLDLNMPGMNGAQALREIRNIAADIPVVIFTACPYGEIIDEAVKYSPAGIVRKPFTSAELLKPIFEVLGHNQRGEP